MRSPFASNPPGNKTPGLFAGVLIASVVVALIPTIWTALDLRAAAIFTGPTAMIHPVHWWWVELINDYVPALFRVCLGLLWMAWVVALLKPRWRTWRLPLAFVVIAGILGPGIVVNWVFKENWQRARPYQVQNFGGPQQFTRAAIITDQCDNNCSFVSGHVACGVFLVSLGLVHRRRQRLWAAAGIAAGMVIGFARMADVAHWLSDVLWAFPITLFTCWLVWKALYGYYCKPSRTEG
jgi:lipid A 4'-phosphatase